MLPAPASSAAWVMVNRHHKKASQIAVKPFCVEKNIPQGRHSVLPLILPLAVMLFVFPCFQCTEVKQPPFCPLPPAPWMGACRISEGTSPVLFL